MTFKREMGKAIKGYLKPLGFKYVAKDFVHIRRYSDDISHRIGYADETHSRPHYYFLKIAVGVASKRLNEILWEATDGEEDSRENVIGPVYLTIYRKALSDEEYSQQKHFIHCEFIGERSMDENLADFDKMYHEHAQTIFNKYSTQKAIFLHPITDPYFNRVHSPCLCFYVPLAYYFNGDFDKAYAYIDKRIEIEEKYIKEIQAKGYTISEETLHCRRVYTAMRKNLKKWIEEKRTFLVDDEYLPNF